MAGSLAGRGRFGAILSEAVLVFMRKCRKTIFRTSTKAVEWMQKALNQMNVQVHRAVADITGATGLGTKKRNGCGSNRIGGVLRMAAVALNRSKSALGAQFRWIARRRNGKIAVFSMARTLATLIYRLLRYGQTYVDIGEKAYEQRFAIRRLRSLQDQAKELGFDLVQRTCPG